MEKRRARKVLTLPEHLCESEDPLVKAKAYTSQLFMLADQTGGSDLLEALKSWLRTLDVNKLENARREYEEAQKLAASVVPFIRSDLKVLMSQHSCGYKDNRKPVTDSGDTPWEMDAFLYEDLDEALESQGLESDRICIRCKSSSIGEAPVVYESVSAESMVNLFRVTLKHLRPRSICVISSKEGALVYGSFLFTNAMTILSYESDPKLVEIQRKIVNRYGMESRVKVAPLQDLATGVNVLDSIDLMIIASAECLNGNESYGALRQKLKELNATIVYAKSDDDAEEIFPELKEFVKLSPPSSEFSTQEFVICTPKKS